MTSLMDVIVRFAPISGIVGIFVLLLGGHWLVRGSVAIARRAGVSTLVVGLTVVAIGTSSPELFFNVIAATSGHTELSFGNVMGSNIANVGLILGISAVAAPLAVHGRVINKELPWLVFVSVAMPAASSDRSIPLSEPPASSTTGSENAARPASADSGVVASESL